MELESEDAKYFGKVDVGKASTLESLRFALESNDILEWQFNFWNAKNQRCVKRKLERFNKFSRQVYVIYFHKGGIEANKSRRFEDSRVIVSSAKVAVAMPEQVEVLEVGGEDAAGLLVGSSRVSGNADSIDVGSNPLKSELLSNDVMDRYLERAKKMWVELKQIAIDDHEWWLKSFDLNSRGVVKLWCTECKKDCGKSSKDHTKSEIDNLFNNFKRSHILVWKRHKYLESEHNLNFLKEHV